MFASTILSVFILGIGGFWYSANGRVADLVLKQKAIFVLNAEIERLSALYVFTGFATDANGPVATSGYSSGVISTTRSVYPADVSSFTGAGNNYVTTSAATFSTGSEFLVWLETNSSTVEYRNYVWIDKSRNI